MSEATSTTTNSTHDPLAARELASAVNTPALLQQHEAANKGKVITRFPPEPNGYLHVGHAKSMNMNFSLAFEKLGVAPENRQTIFRYDDTNPEAESLEYIQSIKDDVFWMGWRPNPITFTSDYFPQLYELAIELIKRGKAYVCHQTKDEMEACREIARAKISDPNAPGNPHSLWRDRSVEENLREFDNMRKGLYAEGAAILRMKMDMSSPNPNMWDQVAYRIKYVPHPHAGDKWCIYPTYDYTHCIIDSLENIDYSICTLEFESRRESYYWVLEALDLYRPKVYEMSRLNIAYTVLSKRKLLKLVNSGYMRGWNDPRMPTIRGLRRRGFTPQVLNAFCNEIGVTRNENFVEYERLTAIARNNFHETSPRVMAVLEPVLLVLTGLEKFSTRVEENGISKVPCQVFDFPFEPSRGGSHIVDLTNRIYVDRSDVRLQDSEDFYGIAAGKVVGLKYAHRIKVLSVETDEANNITLVKAEVLSEDELADVKPKSTIQWLPEHGSVTAEVRLYDHLFIEKEVPDASWEDYLNPKSEVVYPSALVDSHIFDISIAVEKHYQFERIGFFIVDTDSNLEEKKLVFNLTVPLKDSKPKEAGAPSRSRKEEQAKQLAEKMAKMSLKPEDMFKSQTDLYSQFDEFGIPTHDAKGEKISKSMSKKLKKDWDKQKALYESAQNKA